MKNKIECYENHKPFFLTEHLSVTGGSCFNPPKGTTVVVALDHAFRVESLKDSDITEENCIKFIIDDFSVPQDIYSFNSMINQVIECIKDGEMVHIGCLGGHGRTGLVLSVLYTKMTGDRDAINHIRKHYCEYAVETQEQIDFLVDNYNIYEAENIEIDMDVFLAGCMALDSDDFFDFPMDESKRRGIEDEYANMFPEDDLIPLNFHEDFESDDEFSDDDLLDENSDTKFPA